MSATVKLFGFCGVGSFDGKMLAVMPATAPQAGKPHRAFLSVASKDCDLANTEPEFIFYDRNGVQQVGWNVDKKRLGFTGGTGDAKWNDGARERLIDLKRFHSRSTIKLPTTQSAILELTDGTLSYGPEQEFYKVFLGATQKEAAEFSISVVFQVNLTTLKADGKSLVQLKDDAVATISNLAPLRSGHEHFHHYYEFFNEPPSEKVSIDNKDAIRRRGFEIFDCVPPAPLP